jgi:hypothetical protein
MTKLATHVKKEAKEKRIVIDSMKDHFIPHITDKTFDNNMLDDLVGLFQSSRVSK